MIFHYLDYYIKLQNNLLIINDIDFIFTTRNLKKIIILSHHYSELNPMLFQFKSL